MRVKDGLRALVMWGAGAVRMSVWCGERAEPTGSCREQADGAPVGRPVVMPEARLRHSGSATPPGGGARTTVMRDAVWLRRWRFRPGRLGGGGLGRLGGGLKSVG